MNAQIAKSEAQDFRPDVGRQRFRRNCYPLILKNLASPWSINEGARRPGMALVEGIVDRALPRGPWAGRALAALDSRNQRRLAGHQVRIPCVSVELRCR